MSRNKILTVDLADRSYDIIIGAGLIQNAGEYIKSLLPLKKIIIITDENVASIHLKNLEKSLPGIDYKTIILKPGEQTKSFASLENLLDQIFEYKPERKITLIALGGGVIGDLTGFAASILLRGVNFIQIPTTILAQVDSSVGGKTGINNKFGKNLVGSFYQPKLVLADIDAIKTLPMREFLAGYAEIVKYALINDAAFFDWLEENLPAIKDKNPEQIAYMIEKSCTAKSEIVAQDERESGVRALLNLGHSFGHALEKIMGYSGELLHGEAVAIGMVMAFKLSVTMGFCAEIEITKIESHLKNAGLPTSPLDIKKSWNAAEILDIMKQDKKVSDGKMTLILARKIGDSFIEKNVDSEIVSASIKDILNG